MPLLVNYPSLNLSEIQFKRISQLMYRLCGINLHHGKKEMVKARLSKRLRVLKINDFRKYIKYIEQDESGTEIAYIIDSLTTHKTGFFREPKHFEFLRRKILPELKVHRMSIWSAGCSSGEEPYSIAIQLLEGLSERQLYNARILATDIALKPLEEAQRGLYPEEKLRLFPPLLLNKYFTCESYQGVRLFRIKDCVRSLVRFARLNLMDEWPMKGPFNLIVCRNVLIYFDKPTQHWLIERFWNLLEKGDYLFVGHSESLSMLPHKFRFVQPAVYVK